MSQSNPHQTENQSFSIGINGFIVRDNQLLLGKRKNCFGEGDWGLPGGHLEFGESLYQAASRELREETGLEVTKWRFSNLVNYPQNQKHYLQIGFIAEEFLGEPELKEPELCYEWQWFPFEALPQNIFVPHKEHIQTFIEGTALFVDSSIF
jgi:8-oxo-dGTP diphosphatase